MQFMPFSCKLVPIDKLLPETRWDLHPFSTDRDISPHTTRQVHPLLQLPLILKRDSGRYEFITGMKDFLSVHRRTPLENLWCRILPRDTNVPTILSYLFLEHTYDRELNEIELAVFLHLCRKQLNNEEMRALLRELGIRSDTKYLKRTESLLALPDKMKRHMMRGSLQQNTAQELLKLSSEDRNAFFNIFIHLGLGGGKQRRLIEMVRDLAGREGITCSAFLQVHEITEILDHENMNPPQKAQQLLQLLQRRLTPAYNAAEKDFAGWVSRLQLPANQIIEHSPHFEKDTLTLQISFPDKAAVEKVLPQLHRLDGSD